MYALKKKKKSSNTNSGGREFSADRLHCNLCTFSTIKDPSVKCGVYGHESVHIRHKVHSAYYTHDINGLFIVRGYQCKNTASNWMYLRHFIMRESIVTTENVAEEH